MLCQFSFKNFKSYKDETVFDMQAANLPEFAENIIYCKPASNLLSMDLTAAVKQICCRL